MIPSRYIGALAFECGACRPSGRRRNQIVCLCPSTFALLALFALNPDIIIASDCGMPPVPSDEQHERLEPTQTQLLKDRRFKLSRSVIRSSLRLPLAMSGANPVGPTCQSVRSMQVSKLVGLSVLSSRAHLEIWRRRRIKCDEGHPCQPCRHASSACTFEEAGRKSHPHKSKYACHRAHDCLPLIPILE